MKDSDKQFLFETLGARIAPDSRKLDAAGRAEFLRVVEGMVDTRPPLVQRQISLFLKVLNWLPALRYGSPLESLPPETQVKALKWFHSCPVPIFRKGFWGVKTLVLLGYYGRPAVYEEIGYRPSKDGNSKLSPPTGSPQRGDVHADV